MPFSGEYLLEIQQKMSWGGDSVVIDGVDKFYAEQIIYVSDPLFWAQREKYSC